MTEQQLFELLNTITPADGAAMCAAEARQASLAKPPHSLGRLEDISVRLAGIFGTERPTLGRTGVLVFAADNGVCAEGVSCCAAVCHARTGRQHDARPDRHVHAGPVLWRRSDRHRRWDFDRHALPRRARPEDPARHGELSHDQPAMLRSEAVQAISVGIETVREAKAAGLTAVGIGEMGIGNTTTSSAVLCALTGASVADVTGRGGGLTDAGYPEKARRDRSGACAAPPGRKRPNRRADQGWRTRSRGNDRRVPRLRGGAHPRRGGWVHLDRRGALRGAPLPGGAGLSDFYRTPPMRSATASRRRSCGRSRVCCWRCASARAAAAR